MLLGSDKLKQQQNTTTLPAEWLKSKTLTIPKAGEASGAPGTVTQQWESNDTLEDSLAISYDKVNLLLLYKPAIVLPDIYSNELESYVHVKICT